MLKSKAYFLFAVMVILLGSCQVNRYKHNLKTGLWINKDDNGDVIYKSRGRYKYGKEKGTWKYYHDKTLFKKERHNGDTSEMWFYHLNKKVMANGKTEINFNGIEIHWYYTGDWKYFDQQGRLLKTVTYKLGNPIAEVTNSQRD